jgi:hypothetical protein
VGSPRSRCGRGAGPASCVQPIIACAAKRIRSAVGAPTCGSAADTSSPTAPHARLKVTGDGFTGIKVNRYPGGEGRYLEVKDYTGYAENPSAEGRRDIEMIVKACRE